MKEAGELLPPAIPPATTPLSPKIGTSHSGNVRASDKCEHSVSIPRIQKYLLDLTYFA